MTRENDLFQTVTVQSTKEPSFEPDDHFNEGASLLLDLDSKTARLRKNEFCELVANLHE